MLLWNIDKRIIINEHEVHGSTVHTVAFSPGKTKYSSSFNTKEMNVCPQRHYFALLCSYVNSVNNEKLISRSQQTIFLLFYLDGQRILSCGADQCIRVLDVQTGTELYLKDLDDEIRYIAFLILICSSMLLA